MPLLLMSPALISLLEYPETGSMRNGQDLVTALVVIDRYIKADTVLEKTQVQSCFVARGDLRFQVGVEERGGVREVVAVYFVVVPFGLIGPRIVTYLRPRCLYLGEGDECRQRYAASSSRRSCSPKDRRKSCSSSAACSTSRSGR